MRNKGGRKTKNESENIRALDYWAHEKRCYN